MDAFLKNLSHSGQWESTGVFTLNVGAAARKLAAYQLPRPSAWILKMVQAGVVSESPHIIVSHNRQASCFAFASLEPLDPQIIAAGLCQVQEPASRIYEYLVLALRGLVGEQRPFEVRIQNRSRLHRLTWDGGQLKREQQEQPGSNLSLVQVVARYTGDQLNHRAIRASEVRELQHNAHACHVPIRLDGLKINDLAFPAGETGQGQTATLLLAGQAPIPGITEWERPDYLQRLPRPTWNMGRQGHDSQPLISVSAPSRISAIWKVVIGYGFVDDNEGRKKTQRVEPCQRCDQCWWIRHGVVVQVDAISGLFPIGVQLYLSADEFETDLGGFQLLESSRRERQRRIDLLFKLHLRQHLEFLLSALPASPFRFWTVGDVVKAGTVAFVGCSSLIWSPAAAQVLLPLVAAGAQLGCGAFNLLRSLSSQLTRHSIQLLQLYIQQLPSDSNHGAAV
ncbi:hypothetical protein JST97_32040 [bacterium]|nr:hypothetical protein [bacterium]